MSAPVDRRSSGWGQRGRAVVAATAMLAGAMSLAVTPAAVAADSPAYDLRIGRVCDRTLCYVVWGQVDSDGDGYNDADEVVAGTDPLDPASHPGPKDILEVAIGRRLPTFEAGMGAFVALPEMSGVIAGKRYGDDPLVAFPIPQRLGALERLGISAGLLKDTGISVENGFTLGLGAPSAPGKRPPVRVGGIEIGLISAGDGPIGAPVGEGFRSHGDLVVYRPGETAGPGQPHGAVVSRERDSSGVERIRYADGHSLTHEKTGPGAYLTKTYDADKNEVSREVSRSWDDADGTQHTESTTTEKDATGDITSITETESVTHPGGSWGSVTHTTTFHKDADGRATGITKTTTEIWNTATTSTTTQTTEECDAGGENCTSTTIIKESDEEYVNHEAEQFEITDVIIDQVIRGLGAVVTPMRGHSDPVTDAAGPEDPHDITPIALVDDQTGVPTLVLSPPRVTSAQPDVHPGLPNPRESLGIPPGGRLCHVGC